VDQFLILDYGEIKPITQDMIFTAANRAGLKTAVSGYYWFQEMIPTGILNDSFFTPGEDKIADEDVLKYSLPWLEKGDDQLILIHLDQVDYAGHHEGGGVSQGWDEACARVDTEIAQVVANLDLQQDTLLVFSDHGHINAGGHGGTESIVLSQHLLWRGLESNLASMAISIRWTSLQP